MFKPSLDFQSTLLFNFATVSFLLIFNLTNFNLEHYKFHNENVKRCCSQKIFELGGKDGDMVNFVCGLLWEEKAKFEFNLQKTEKIFQLTFVIINALLVKSVYLSAFCYFC